MTHTLKTALLALALACVVGITTAHATANGRAVFRRTDRQGNVSRIVVLHGCADAEDTASTLHMVQRPVGYGDGRIVLTCNRKGY